MVSRFFGKSSGKKVPPPPDPTSTTEEDDFTVIRHRSPKRSAADQQHRNSRQEASSQQAHSAYPNLDNSEGPRRRKEEEEEGAKLGAGAGGGGGGGGGGYSTSTLTSQSSMTNPQVLDGVPFVLSGRCRGVAAGRARELDQYLDRTETYLEGVQELIRRSANHDFRLEKNVVESDITATMRRAHLDSFS